LRSCIEHIIRSNIEEQEAREVQPAENHQSKDILPLEEAGSLKACFDRYKVFHTELLKR
jgi:hypothetical protein